MNSKNTWVWLLVAAVLIGLAVASRKFSRTEIVGPVRVMPEFNAAIISSIQVTPADQLEIRAEKTNAIWQLVKPITYPAQSGNIDRLLAAIESLTVAARISGTELRKRADAEKEFGIEPPQYTVVVQDQNSFRQIKVGALTAPGDQVYIQIVGVDGLFVVDADWLKLLPRKADDWRDLALIDLKSLAYDRIAVSNSVPFELQRAGTNAPWTGARPVPGARVDQDRLLLALQKLQSARVAQFVADGPQADLQSFGLQPPELQVSFGQGTNRLVRLEFGKIAGTNANQIYARRPDRGSVVTVPKALVESWYEPFEKVRDHRLITFNRPLDQVEVRGDETFTILWQSGTGWKIQGREFPVDNGAIDEFMRLLAGMSIVGFMDVDLQANGLTDSKRQVVFRSAVTNTGVVSNLVLFELTFGHTNANAVYVRRSDENAVYSVPLANVQGLPTAAWQLRQRRVWKFTPDEVERIHIRHGDQSRELVHIGTNVWTSAEKLQVGEVVESLAVEALSHELGELGASVWVEPEAKDLSRYGIATNGNSIVVKLTNGEKRELRFGGTAPSQYPYAAVMVDGQTWVMEFPLQLYHNLYFDVLRKLGLLRQGF
jgi:hypothetical protein